MASELPPGSLTAGLGMPEGAERVYGLLLDRDTAGIEDLADALGMPVADVTTSVDWLRERGLVLRAAALAMTGGPQRWAAADPDHAVRNLVRERERALHEVRGALPDLQQRFRQAHAHDSRQVIEHLDGWENVGDRYYQLLRDAHDEIAMWDHGPYTAGAAPTERSVLERGVPFRVLCDPVDFPEELARDFATQPGLEARLTAGLPFRGIVADRRAALITMDREPQNLIAVVVHPSPLLDGLVLLFDALWARGVPLESTGETLAEPERQVLVLLAAGLKDEAIARQLGTTARTVRRRIQTVLTALGARSRFHAGVEAHRRGWV